MAKSVKETEALQLATSFQQQRHPSKLRAAVSMQLVYQGSNVGLRSTLTEPALYIYNSSDNQGFVIVSGEDVSKPILGYSDEGAFQVANMPDNLKSWLHFYEQEIEALRHSETVSLPSNIATKQVSTIATSTSIVAPLLGDIKWNQSDPYNLLCPWDEKANKHALTGCGATAMAQIMKYHNWPLTGTSSNSYTDSIYGTHTVDFSETNYDWTNMLGYYGNTATEVQRMAIATLMYHCGVSVNMEYSPTASSASILDIIKALVNYFGYDSDIQLLRREYYSAEDWNTLIKIEMDSSRPVLYRGQTDDESGHLFVCDGYDSNNMFHINWGWGGTSNGFFELSALASDSPGEVGFTGGYASGQKIISNLHKADAIDNPYSQISIYKKGMSSSSYTISDVRTKSFDISYGFSNSGSYNSTGKCAVGYIENNSVNILKESINGTLPPNYHYDSYTFTGINVPAKAGIYNLIALFKASGSTTWNKIQGSHFLNNSLTLTVANDLSATIQKPAPISLSLTSNLVPSTRLYQNTIINVDISVQNSGPEFFSNLGLCLVSATDPNTRSFICENFICCPAGETKTFHLSGTVTAPPGNYDLVAQFDSTDSDSRMDYKTFGPANLNSLKLEVLPMPGPSALLLNENIVLTSESNISKNDTLEVSANITNTGGFFNEEIIAFVFPKSGGSSLTYLTPQLVTIDSLETKVVKFSGSLDLPIGEYYLNLYYHQDNSWTKFSPSNMGSINFNITDVSSIINQQIETSFITITRVGDRLNIETTDKIQQVQLFDLAGRIIRKTNTDRSIPIGDLSPGVYLIRIESNGKYYLERFLK